MTRLAVVVLATVVASASAAAQSAAALPASPSAAHPAPSAVAATSDSVRVVPVELSGQSPVATVRNAITGRESVEVSVTATRGQIIFADLQTTAGSLNFNVWAPGVRQTALFRGDVDGTHFTMIAPATGTYTLSISLLRSVARREVKRPFTLTLGRSAGPVGSAPPRDARVKGTPYHATSAIRCQMTREASLMQCDVGVIRGARGNAEVHVTTPDGGRRVFRITGAAVASLDTRRRTVAKRDVAGWVVMLDGVERFEIPDAVVRGG